jgi:hypothetical protein
MVESSGKGGRLSRRAARLGFAGIIAIAPAPLATAMEFDGDANALTVVLEDEARPQVVAELAARLGFRVVGNVVDDGTVSGRFRGDLAKVLGSVLTQNGFVIVYESGRPSQLLLSAKDPNGASASALDGSRSLLPGGYIQGDPNFPNQGTGMVTNPDGTEYIPDPTEMPVETPVDPAPEIHTQQGIVQ